MFAPRSGRQFSKIEASSQGHAAASFPGAASDFAAGMKPVDTSMPATVLHAAFKYEAMLMFS